MKVFKSLFIVLLFISFTSLTLSSLNQEKKPGTGQVGLEEALAGIKPMEVYNYCKTISSEKFAGRLTGHEGYTAAAKWAAGKFREWGLSPLSETAGYLQAYPSPYTVVEAAKMSLFLTPGAGGEAIELQVGKDFLPLLYTDSGDHRADLVFAGWGICAPGIGYDDYAGLDVKGKFVLCFRGTPDRSDKRFTPYDYHRYRMKTAMEKGALGIFYIYPEPLANPNGEWLEGFTPAIISYETADKLLKPKGFSAETLKAKLNEEKQPHSFQLDAQAHYQVKSHHFPTGTGYNVIGIIPGSDRQLKKKCLLIGGHFDHCGLHMGLHFPGANDNASGSAAVMEIARAFSQLTIKPKRTVVFVLFGGEEMGLTGSKYMAEHLPPGIKKVDSMFNFDMVGEGEGTICVMSKKRPHLEKALQVAAKQVPTLRNTHYLGNIGPRSSDFAPFYLKGASCISFFSNGPHLHYHKTGDTIYRINPDIMADIARLAFLTGYLVADR